MSSAGQLPTAPESKRWIHSGLAGAETEPQIARTRHGQSRTSAGFNPTASTRPPLRVGEPMPPRRAPTC